MKITAFAPGHITGFFQPCYDKNILKTGSRGAGFSISLGATAELSIKHYQKQSIHMYVNKKKQDIPVVSSCIRSLLSNKPYEVLVFLKTDLPFSQGFGMSAACALSTAVALCEAVHLPREKAIQAAHIAEIQAKTGLGDVVASSIGGIEIRKNPGVSPYGNIQTIPGSFDMILCVIDKGIHTKNILQDDQLSSIINSIGEKCTNSLIEKPSIENFFILSNLFVKQTGIATPLIRKIIKEIEKTTPVSMCMLGNSLFTQKNETAIAQLNNKGTLYETSVDTKGARILSSTV